MLLLPTPTLLLIPTLSLLLHLTPLNGNWRTSAQVVSQTVAAVHAEAIPTPPTETYAAAASSDSFVITPQFSFEALLKQRSTGNQVAQCPCVILPGTDMCISYDARFQAATVEEAMLTFVDMSMDPRIFEARLPGGGPISQSTFECPTDECRQCVGMLALRLRQVGLVRTKLNFPFDVPAESALKFMACPRIRMSRSVPWTEPPSNVPTFINELINAAAPLRRNYEQSETRSSFSLAVERALWESRESGNQPLISRFVAEVEGRVSATSRVSTSAGPAASSSVASSDWSSWSSWRSSSTSVSDSIPPVQAPVVSSSGGGLPQSVTAADKKSGVPNPPQPPAPPSGPTVPAIAVRRGASQASFPPSASPPPPFVNFVSNPVASAPESRSGKGPCGASQPSAGGNPDSSTVSQGKRRRRASPSDPLIGNRFVINCAGKGEAENEETQFLNLCTMCWTWRQLPDEYFPRLLNELVCQESDYCLSGWGSCRQRHRNVDILKKVGGEWKPTTISIATCCDCKVKAGSEIHSLVVGKNKP